MTKNRKIQIFSRREEKKKIRRTVYLSIGSMLLLVFLFTLGVPILGKFADLLDVVFKKKTSESQNTSVFLNAPRLDDLPQATNSAKIQIQGYAQDETTVEIFFNDEKAGTATVSSGRFKFEDGRLEDNDNQIKARAAKDGKEGDFSETINIKLDTEVPTLQIENPTDGQSFSGVNRISVSGKTEKDAQVFANGFLANVDSEGKFQVFVTLNEGDNDVEVKAIDAAGNTKSEKRKVHYSK